MQLPSERRDSNSRPSPWQGDALPTELRSHTYQGIWHEPDNLTARHTLAPVGQHVQSAGFTASHWSRDSSLGAIVGAAVYGNAVSVHQDSDACLGGWPLGTQAAALVVQWARKALEAVEGHREEMNRANVFPVADGDTGTNVYITLRSGCQELDRLIAPVQQRVDPAAALLAFAHGALLGAKGNSGVIMAQWLRGFAQSLSTGAGLDQALQTAARNCVDAVTHPAPGTVLTTAAAVAARAASCDKPASPSLAHMVDVLTAVSQTAAQSLKDSWHNLAVLQRNRVRDAGAAGFFLLLDSLRYVLECQLREHDVPACGVPGQDVYEQDVHEQQAPGRDARQKAPALATASAPAEVVLPCALTDIALTDIDAIAPESSQSDGQRQGAGHDHGSDHGHDSSHDHGDEFEVMFIFRQPVQMATEDVSGPVAQRLRQELETVGGSVVVVGGAQDHQASNLWQVHVHVTDLAPAIQLARRWAIEGVVEPLRITHCAVPDADLAVIAVAQDAGAAAELARAGANVVLAASAPIAVEHLLRAAQDRLAQVTVILAPDLAGIPVDLADTVMVTADGDQATLDAMAVLVEAVDMWAFEGQVGSPLQVIQQACAQIPGVELPGADLPAVDLPAADPRLVQPVCGI